MKSKEEKAIEFQLKDLDTSLFEGSEKIIKVKVEVGSGAYEDLIVFDDGVMLVLDLTPTNSCLASCLLNGKFIITTRT